MSTVIARLYNWVTDKANSVKITASKQDGELDQIIVGLNRKVLCSGSAPSSPIAGQTWVDTTQKLFKTYRNNEWVITGIVHVSSTAPTTMQSGDVWVDLSGGENIAKIRNQANDAWITLSQTPTDWRREMFVAQASTVTITIALGYLEVGGALITKTSVTTLNLTTASHWAGGSSLQATDTTGFVGVDASGNIKLHTTAPTHSDYAVSITAGTKRYVTWSGTVYRVIGWFRMNSTGSGELDSYGVSNIADGNVRNRIKMQTGAVVGGATAMPDDNTTPQISEGAQYMVAGIRPTNVLFKLKITVTAMLDTFSGAYCMGAIFQGATADAIASSRDVSDASGGGPLTMIIPHDMVAAVITYLSFQFRAGVAAGSNVTLNGYNSIGKLNGTMASSIEIEEIEG